MSENYEIRVDDPKPHGDDAVLIKSPTLLKGLIKNPDATLKLLSGSVFPISLPDIDIDKDGAVIIKNKEFREAILQSALAGGNTMGNNCAC